MNERSNVESGRQHILIASLQDQGLYDHPVSGFQLHETHISWVIRTGEYAYKIKKPVDFGFLDYSSLEKRRQYCLEELRLNRRFAPELYLEVVPITGTPEQPMLYGEGEAIEFAVKMREFRQSALLNRMAGAGSLTTSHIDGMIHTVAGFHDDTDAAGPGMPYGLPEDVHHWVTENFEHIHSRLPGEESPEDLDRVEEWTVSEYSRRSEQIRLRKDRGFVRECHGDLHLGNMVLINEQVTLFDCIEFNANLRWIDVMSEVAFVVMDLDDRGYPQFAWRFLNGYLQHTGDYGGLSVLSYYLVYRALVRAKVAILSLGQVSSGDSVRYRQIIDEYRGYTGLARTYTSRSRPSILIMHGVSGSGKSSCAARLAEELGAIRIRSDVERKRLHGYAADANSQSGIKSGIYTEDAGRRTYERLAEMAACIVDGGFIAIVDATFLEQVWRSRFQRLAEEHNAAFLILDMQAPVEVLRERVRSRQSLRSDASEAGESVLGMQLRSQQSLTEEEMPDVLSVDTRIAWDIPGLMAAIRARLSV